MAYIQINRHFFFYLRVSNDADKYGHKTNALERKVLILFACLISSLWDPETKGSQFLAMGTLLRMFSYTEFPRAIGRSEALVTRMVIDVK